jgi:zinc protease
LQRLREAEGEVYSPQVSMAFNKYPQNRFAIVIQFGCSPQNADHLVSLLEEEIKKLRENGPQPDDIRKFKAQYRKTVELALNDNNFWYTYLLNQSENYDNLLQVQDLMKNIETVDFSTLKKATQLFLSEKNVINFELLPEVKN